ncbi:MAG TPA: tetratricopeptide repeat protein [Polyangiaceae bacterium]|jgi:tetratricopeptide (TPR) repeat protein
MRRLRAPAMIRLARATATLALAWSFATPARAETPPGAWDIAKDPAERDRWALHVRVERLMHPPAGEGGLRFDDELRLEAACAMLEEADAARSPDVRLRFDLGIVYSELATRQRRNDLQQKVIDVLAPVLEAPQSPDDGAATAALEALVYAYAKLARPEEELATWRRYIPRLIDDRVRATAMMNMGEAEMRLGRVDEALGTFREVLRLCGELPNTPSVGSTYVLALWDVAVALDRSGDPRTALDTAAKASHVDLGGRTGAYLIAKDPDVFFVPDWERLWYLALGAEASAREAADPRDAASLWAAADRALSEYIGRAVAAGGRDPWLAIARVRLGRVQAERAGAEKRGAKLPPRPSSSGTRGGAWIGD